jgi:thioredoxin-like negative regulator of GroEL
MRAPDGRRTHGAFAHHALPVALALVLSLAGASCAPDNILMTKKTDRLDDIERVGVLLFEHPTAPGNRQVAEEITEIFSIQARRYFPQLVERFDIQEELAARGEKIPTTLTPESARRLGDMFGCDAFFIGRITTMKDGAALIAPRGSQQFGISVTLVSAHTGETLIAADVIEDGSFLAPQDTPKELAMYCVKEMVERFGFTEKETEWLTRRSDLWVAAMKAYEERRFWDAACLFGEVVSQHPVNLLTEEAYLLLGRCFDELALEAGARRSWRTLAMGFPRSEFTPAAVGEMAALAYEQGRAVEGDSLLTTLRSRKNENWEAANVARAITHAVYASALVAKRSGDFARAQFLFESIPVSDEYGPFARYGTAECLAALGQNTAALSALRDAAKGADRSRSHEALATEAWLANGRYALSQGDPASAHGAFTHALGAAGDDGRASVGLAWAHLARGDRAAATRAIDGALPSGRLDRLDALLLNALARRDDGDLDDAEQLLESARLEAIELRKAATSPSAREGTEKILENLRSIEEDAWRAVMGDPGEARSAECARVGGAVVPLAAGLASNQERMRLEVAAAGSAGRIALIEERCDLLLAQVLLERGGDVVRRPPAGPAPATNATTPVTGGGR